MGLLDRVEVLVEEHGLIVLDAHVREPGPARGQGGAELVQAPLEASVPAGFQEGLPRGLDLRGPTRPVTELLLATVSVLALLRGHLTATHPTRAVAGGQRLRRQHVLAHDPVLDGPVVPPGLDGRVEGVAHRLSHVFVHVVREEELGPYVRRYGPGAGLRGTGARAQESEKEEGEVSAQGVCIGVRARTPRGTQARMGRITSPATSVRRKSRPR